MSIDCWSDEHWTDVVGSKPLSELCHVDFSEPYQMQMMHVFLLADGKYVVVHESGCSCYEPSEADLELLPFARAIERYIEYKKEHGGTFTNLELLEMKSLEKENELLNRDKPSTSA